MVKTETNAIHPATFMNQPVAAPHQAFLPIGSEVPSSLAASPRGKPRCSCGSWFHSTLCSVPSANGRLRRSGRQVGDPYRAWRKLLACSNQRTTPPQSARSGCQLPQRWSQGHFVPAGRQIGDPYRRVPMCNRFPLFRGGKWSALFLLPLVHFCQCEI